MLSISPDILKQFDAVLEKKAIPFSIRADYRKLYAFYIDKKLAVKPSRVSTSIQ
jgi:hypothetical protein